MFLQQLHGFFKLPENLACKNQGARHTQKDLLRGGGNPIFLKTAGVFGAKLWGLLGEGRQIFLILALSVHASRFDDLMTVPTKTLGELVHQKQQHHNIYPLFFRNNIHLRMKVGSQHHNNHGLVWSQHHNIHLTICGSWTCFFRQDGSTNPWWSIHWS